jgi:hypothetical protein
MTDMIGPPTNVWMPDIRSAICAVRSWSGADQRQQHHGRLGGHERVGCLRCHVEPGTGAQIQLLTVDGEAKPTRHDLDHGCAGGLMLGELLASIEAEDGDLEPIASVNDLGDDGASLDCYFACRIADQCVGHLTIMLRGAPATHIGLPAHPR